MKELLDPEAFAGVLACRDGPVLNIDDDSKMLPPIFDRVWAVRRAIAWQVGNMIPGCQSIPPYAECC